MRQFLATINWRGGACGASGAKQFFLGMLEGEMHSNLQKQNYEKDDGWKVSDLASLFGWIPFCSKCFQTLSLASIRISLSSRSTSLRTCLLYQDILLTESLWAYFKWFRLISYLFGKEPIDMPFLLVFYSWSLENVALVDFLLRSSFKSTVCFDRFLLLGSKVC